MYFRSDEVPADSGVRANVFPTKSIMCRHGDVENLRHDNEQNNYSLRLEINVGRVVHWYFCKKAIVT